MAFKEKIENNKFVVITTLVTASIVGLGQIFDVWKKIWEEFEVKPEIEIQNESTFTKSDIGKIYSIIPELTYSANDSTTTFDEVIGFFRNDNKVLIDSISIRLSDNKNSLIFLSGPAGVGKSYVFRHLEKVISCDSCNTIKIDLNKFADRDHLNPKYFEMKADLRNLSNSTFLEKFSSLPSLKTGTELSIDSILSIAAKVIDSTMYNTIVFDDFDEIHKSFCRKMINYSIEYLKKRNIKVNILILGRPESFNDYYTETSRIPYDIGFYKMQIPHFKTYGDIRLRVQGYFDYINNMNDPTPTINNLSGLLYEKTAHINDIGHLSVGNDLIQAASIKANYNMDELEKYAFESMLKRNHDTHGRPTQEDELYIEILKEIARKYSAQLDEKGYFKVGPQDKVAATVRKPNSVHEVKFRVRDILSRSGIIDMNPLSFSNPKYRFQPLWIHAYLLKESL